MFLPALARDLYKSQKKVEILEQQFENADTSEIQEKLKTQLRQARAELEQLRKMLDGRKEQSRASQHKPRSLF